ncbi:MAG: DUF6062 family protein [Candidatus Bathyarchaeia archaeon]
MTEKNLLTVKIFEAIKKSEGCPLCYLWLKVEEQYMDFLLLNEASMSSKVRNEVVAAKGFCNRHAHLLYKTAYKGGTEDGLGYAIYMKDIIEIINKQLEPLTKQSRNLGDLKKKIFPHWRKQKQTYLLLFDIVEHVIERQQCPVCKHLQSMDKINQHTLIQMLEVEEFQKEFKSSKGLCLPHFMSAIRILGQNKLKNPSTVAKALIETEKGNLQLVEHYLSEFIRKQSWDFREESWGPEANANRMALNLLVGAEGFCLNDG